MILKLDYAPQYRDADADGFIGARGYLSYFQDIAGTYMFNLDLGNNVLPQKYNCVWVYTKYRLKVFKKADYSDKIATKCWLEENASPMLTNHAMEMRQNGELCAIGRLESCVLDRARNRVTRLSQINFSNEKADAKPLDLPAFIKIDKSFENMEYVFTHTVRYDEIDVVGHMTNLKYVNLLLNSFNAKFHAEHILTDLEIHFVNQCYEGEEIKVYKQKTDNSYRILGQKADGSIAVLGNLSFNY